MALSKWWMLKSRKPRTRFEFIQKDPDWNRSLFRVAEQQQKDKHRWPVKRRLVLIDKYQNGAKLESRQSVAIMGVSLSSSLYCELQRGLINACGFCPRWCHSTKMKWDTVPECHLQEFQRLINLSSKGSKLSPFFRCSFIILDSSGAFIIYRPENSIDLQSTARSCKCVQFCSFFSSAKPMPCFALLLFGMENLFQNNKFKKAEKLRSFSCKCFASSSFVWIWLRLHRF